MKTIRTEFLLGYNVKERFKRYKMKEDDV